MGFGHTYWRHYGKCSSRQAHECAKPCYIRNVCSCSRSPDETVTPCCICGNYSSYSNTGVDQYLLEARQTDDPELRAEAYDKFQVELAKDPAYAFICYVDASYVADAKIRGIEEDTVMGHHGVGIFWNVTQWVFEK